MFSGMLLGPDAEHEEARRKIQNGVVEFWYYINDQLSSIKQANQGNTQLVSHINDVMEDSLDHHR